MNFPDYRAFCDQISTQRRKGRGVPQKACILFSAALCALLFSALRLFGSGLSGLGIARHALAMAKRENPSTWKKQLHRKGAEDTKGRKGKT